MKKLHCVCPRDFATVTATLEEMIGAIVEEFLEPEVNGIIPKSD